MTADELEALLADTDVPQRAKLDELRAQVAVIRGLDDAAFVRVVRAIKKKLSSPKIADDVAALVHAASTGRAVRAIAAPRVEPAPVPWVGSMDLDETVHAIEAVIAADPEAQEPYTVLGDYWSSSGDPRGELIAIGHALAKNPKHRAMRSAWTQWMVDHARALWGEHGITQHCLREVDWYMGFIRACTVSADYRVDTTALLATVLDVPGPGRFIQRLVIDGPLELAAVIARRPRPTLRTLALGHHGGPSGDMSMLWPAVPRLRELRCEGAGPSLGVIEAPMLERFVFDFGYAPGGVQSLDGFASLMAARGVPALRALAITNCRQADELCAALVDSPLAGQLVELDLAPSTMTAAGVALLVAHRDRFPHVRRWELELDHEDAAGREQVATLPGEVVINDRYGEVGE